MRNSGGQRRIITGILVGSLLLVAVLTVFHLIFTERILTDLYSGKRADFLGMHVHPEQKSLGACVEEINSKFLTYVVAGIPLTLVCWFFIFSIFRFLFRRVGEPLTDSQKPRPPTMKHWWLIAILVYTLLTCVYFYPCLGTLSSSLIGPPEDNLQTYWGLSWGNEKVLHGDKSFSEVNDLFYPEGSSFYYHSWSFYNQAVSAGLRLFFNQVTSYNLLILMTFVIAGLGAFLLARYLIHDFYLSLLAGFLFAFNPSHLAHAQHHLNIASIQFVPFFVLFFVKAVRRQGMWSLPLTALFLLLNTLCDWNYFIMAFWFMIFGYVYLAIRRQRLWLPDVALKSGATVGLPLVLLSPWLIPMIAIGLQHPESTTFGHHTFVADLAGLLIPPAGHILGATDIVTTANATFTGNQWEATAYLGLVAVAIVVISARKVIAQSAKYLLGGLAFLLIALGPQPHFAGKMLPIPLPDRLIMMSPFLGNARAPSRFIVYVYLFWGIVVAISLRHVLAAKLRPLTHYGALAIIPLLLFFDYFSVVRDTAPVTLPECYSVMERGGERYGILDLPSGYANVDRYMMYQALHGLPIVQGWASRKIGKSLMDHLELEDLVKQHAQLVSNKVKYIVIHRVLAAESPVDTSAYLAQYERVFDDSEAIVMKVY